MEKGRGKGSLDCEPSAVSLSHTLSLPLALPPVIIIPQMQVKLLLHVPQKTIIPLSISPLPSANDDEMLKCNTKLDTNCCCPLELKINMVCIELPQFNYNFN